MFKRSLTAVAVIGTLAMGSAMAGEVQLYGVLDTGFAFTRVKTDNEAATTTFGMGSGISGSSRIGVKGMEELGNDLSVGFKMEAPISSTTGAAGKENGVFFHREMYVNLSGPFGAVYAGRLGALRSGNGDLGIGDIDPLGFGGVIGGFGNLAPESAVERLDNAIAYATPEFNGVQVYAMYGMGDKVQNKSYSTGRYLGLGATYEQGPLSLVAVVDSVFTPGAKEGAKLEYNKKNEFGVTLGASYDFDVVKPTLQVAFYRHRPETGFKSFHDGFQVQLGAEVPAGPGTFVATIGYGKADLKSNEAKKAITKTQKDTYLNLGAGYVYPLSKRTSLYAGAGYLKTKSTPVDKKASSKKTTLQAGFGLRHDF